MSNDAFRPTGATVTVDGTARQAVCDQQTSHMQYRVRNLAGTAAYFAWNTPKISSGGTPSMSVTLPVAGTPQDGVIGMLPSSVEVFTLPTGAWFMASGGTFEVTPGEGV